VDEEDTVLKTNYFFLLRLETNFVVHEGGHKALLGVHDQRSLPAYPSSRVNKIMDRKYV